MKDLREVMDHLATSGRVVGRAVKLAEQAKDRWQRLEAERDLYRAALRDIRDGRTNDPAYLAEDTLRKAESL